MFTGGSIARTENKITGGVGQFYEQKWVNSRERPRKKHQTISSRSRKPPFDPGRSAFPSPVLTLTIAMVEMMKSVAIKEVNV